MNRFYFIAVILVIGLIAAAIVWNVTSIAYFLDVPSLIVVIVPVLALCFATFSPRDMGRSFRAAFSRGQVETSELKTAAVFFRALERYILLSGFLGALLGVMSLLWMMRSDTKIATGFAMLLISVFYALILLFVLAVPFRVAVDRKLVEAEL